MMELPFDYNPDPNPNNKNNSNSNNHSSSHSANGAINASTNTNTNIKNGIKICALVLSTLVFLYTCSRNLLNVNVTSNVNDISKVVHEQHHGQHHQHENHHHHGQQQQQQQHHDTVAYSYRPLVISGPSGVGKGTLIDKLVGFYNHKVDEMIESHEFKTDDDNNSNSNNHNHDLFGFSVSHTTRNPRPGEVNGTHYHFTTIDKMKQDIQQNDKFIEYATVHNNLYGTSYKSVQDVISKHQICILDIDIQGVKRIKERQQQQQQKKAMSSSSTSSASTSTSTLNIKPYFIFIAPPSMEILEQRLRDRKTETEDAIRNRIKNARNELEYGTANGHFDEIIVNDDLNITFLRLRHVLEEWYDHLNQIPSPSHEF